jgi:sugar/nucleoside kinase (ribokinase family)
VSGTGGDRSVSGAGGPAPGGDRAARPRVVTAGETMALLDPVEDGELELDRLLRLRIAGAESNFAIALARLGVPVAWISRLGDDRLGALVRGALADEGVDLRWVRTDPGAPTGLFVKWRAGGRSSVAYYRRGSAASRLAAGDVPDEALAAASLVHLTGITMALSESARELVVDVVRRARAAGATVVFDPNFRPALWDRPEAAGAAMEPVLEHIDWYLCGAEEGGALLGTGGDGRGDAARAVIAALRERGVPGAVVRIGADGALVAHGDAVAHVAPRRTEEVIDEIGAGDAFAAGFAYGLLQGWDAERCTQAANAIAACALRGTGDWETLPRLDEVRALLPM